MCMMTLSPAVAVVTEARPVVHVRSQALEKVGQLAADAAHARIRMHCTLEDQSVDQRPL